MTDPTPPQSTAPTTSDIYDRQIRLWGSDAQTKISSATILYIHITGVSSEILKNLVLAGVQPAICDGRPYPEVAATTPSSFFSMSDEPEISPEEKKENHKEQERPQKKQRNLSVASVMQPNVHELNPLLHLCEMDEREIETIPDDFFSRFNVVIASRLGKRQACRIASSVTASGGKFILVDCFGMKGCAFLDLGPSHTYRKEIGKNKLSDPIKIAPYIPLKDMFEISLGEATDRWNKQAPPILASYRSVLEFHEQFGKWPDDLQNQEEFSNFTRDYLVRSSRDHAQLPPDYLGGEKDLRTIASLSNAQISPVCAILGGVIGNEVIKAISGKGEPANNVLMFDGLDGGCRSFLMQPKKKL